ncbi:NAD(P)-binding protein [Peniophora sp. CONT]|nr:NAD(P)-binding protein [Peniophora sp. CONT]
MTSDPSKHLVWLVTGASSGLGLALVKCILARGDCVIATARTTYKFDGLFVNSDMGRIHIMALDVTASFKSIQQVIESAILHFGRVDVLVNNAGTTDQVGPGEEVGIDGFDRVTRTNFYGVVNCTNAILPHMRARKDGSIIFIGSRSAYATEQPVSLSAYGASKAAVHAYGETLAAEVRPMNIRVSIVIPGTFKTAFTSPEVVSPKFTDYQYFHDIVAHVIRKKNEDLRVSDPEKGMSVLVDVVRGEGRAARKEGWPLWLVLGEDALADLKKRAETFLRSLNSWGDLGQGLTVELPNL